MRVITENIEAKFEELDRVECLQLLGWEALGRLATCKPGSGPEIVPVNFLLDGDAVVFRCTPARAANLAGRHASFEIDRFDSYHRLGWSVVVSGTLTRVPEDAYPDEVVAAWAPGDRHSMLRLEPDEITGRRIAPRPWYHGEQNDLGYL
jgi:nitroimidazol reductase NimA-like FMN-containing flavoprotein (pyridoxamine 5'-phosphate oxidase superfamily)